MISVLLTLLKIIGIILLVLLGLILGLILLVLFVPVRYRLKGYYKDELVVHGKVTWLLHFLSVTIDYDKEPVTSIKLLGISLDKFIKKGVNPVKNDEPDSATNTDIYDSSHKSESPNLVDINATVSNNSITDTSAVPSSVNTLKINDTSINEKNIGKICLSDKFKNLFQSIKEKIIAIYCKICNIFNKIKQIINKIKSGKETAEYYISILKREEVKQALALCKKRIWKIIKHILPKKMKVNLTIGFDDPATTGYVLAGYSVLPPSISKNIILHTDFDRQIIDCDFNIKWHVNAWSILYQVLCVVIDKNCKLLYQIVKKEILNERK